MAVVEEVTGLHRSELSRNRGNTNREVTPQFVARLAAALEYRHRDDLITELGRKPSQKGQPHPIPTAATLTRQRTNLQGADYRNFVVSHLPWTMRCNIVTRSPYVRYGVKLLTEEGRLFGDALICSADENFLIHVGRNNWNRPNLGIGAGDVFSTVYKNGVLVEDDRFLFPSSERLAVDIELRVDLEYCFTFLVNRTEVFRRIISPALCNRICMYAWGDGEDFEVEVTNLALEQHT